MEGGKASGKDTAEVLHARAGLKHGKASLGAAACTAALSGVAGGSMRGAPDSCNKAL